MGLGKWIGGWLGWIMSQSILGAMVGYALGSMFDSLFGGGEERIEDDSSSSYGGWQQTDSYENQRAAEGDRNSFLFSLMVLAAHLSPVSTDAATKAEADSLYAAEHQ